MLFERHYTRSLAVTISMTHSWAVAALEACPCGYDQVNQHVLAVSTYLGHAKLESTYLHLHTTPQLLADIAARSE